MMHTLAAVPASAEVSPPDSPSVPAAVALIFGPCARRRKWAAVYQCPWCGGWHFARSASLEDLAGTHRAAGCKPVEIIPGGAL